MAIEDLRATNRSIADKLVSADGRNKPDIATTVAQTIELDAGIAAPPSSRPGAPWAC